MLNYRDMKLKSILLTAALSVAFIAEAMPQDSLYVIYSVNLREYP